MGRRHLRHASENDALFGSFGPNLAGCFRVPRQILSRFPKNRPDKGLGPLLPLDSSIARPQIPSPDPSQMRHVLSATVQNVPGVLAHVAGMFASRGYNIDSLAVGETEDPRLSRMTFVVVGDDSVLQQVRKQLEKIVTVVRVDDVSSHDHVERDLMLIKVRIKAGQRAEIRELTDIFRGRIVDVAPNEVTVEIAGQEKKIEAFIDLMRPFGIVELVRSGRIAIVRSIDRSNNATGGLKKYAGEA